MLVWGYLRHYQNVRMLWSVYTEFELVPAYARVWSPAEGFYLPPIMQYVPSSPLVLLLADAFPASGPRSSYPSSSSNSYVLCSPTRLPLLLTRNARRSSLSGASSSSASSYACCAGRVRATCGRKERRRERAERARWRRRRSRRGRRADRERDH